MLRSIQGCRDQTYGTSSHLDEDGMLLNRRRHRLRVDLDTPNRSAAAATGSPATRMAVKQARPNLTDKEVDDLLAESAKRERLLVLDGLPFDKAKELVREELFPPDLDPWRVTSNTAGRGNALYTRRRFARSLEL